MLLDGEGILHLQHLTREVHCAEPLVRYVQDLLDFSRSSGLFAVGLSPRAGLSLLKAARAWALLQGRGHVLPEDVQQVLPQLAGHRLRKADTFTEMPLDELVTAFHSVPVPV